MNIHRRYLSTPCPKFNKLLLVFYGKACYVCFCLIPLTKGGRWYRLPSSLLEEKGLLEKQSANSGQQVNKWIEIAENVFKFASDARERFETGNWQIRKQILGALGSNLILKDQILSIDIEKALLSLQIISKEFSYHPIRLEPLSNGSTKRKTDVFASASPALLQKCVVIGTGFYRILSRSMLLLRYEGLMSEI